MDWFNLSYLFGNKISSGKRNAQKNSGKKTDIRATEHHPPRRGQQAAPFPYPKLNPAQLPLAELAVALGRSTQTYKQALRELETAGLILRVRQEIGAPNRIYVLVPRKQD